MLDIHSVPCPIRTSSCTSSLPLALAPAFSGCATDMAANVPPAAAALAQQGARQDDRGGSISSQLIKVRLRRLSSSSVLHGSAVRALPSSWAFNTFSAVRLPPPSHLGTVERDTATGPVMNFIGKKGAETSPIATKTPAGVVPEGSTAPVGVNAVGYWPAGTPLVRFSISRKDGTHAETVQ